MYRLDINFLSNRQYASQCDSANGLSIPQNSSISVFMKCTDGEVKLIRQLKRFVQINLTRCTDGVIRLFGRINRVIRTYFNKTEGQTKAPETILEQSIIEMQEELRHLHQSVARASAIQKRIYLQRNRVQNVSNLQINLLRGRQYEPLIANNGQDIQLTKNSFFAKIRSNLEYSPQKTPILPKIGAEMATILKAQLDEQTALVDNLKRQMIALESKILEAKTKKTLLESQVAAAKAHEQLQNTLCRLRTQKIREKILQIDVRLQTRLQGIAVLIFWKEELTTWKFQLLYRLILEQQEDLESLDQLES